MDRYLAYAWLYFRLVVLPTSIVTAGLHDLGNVSLSAHYFGLLDGYNSDLAQYNMGFRHYWFLDAIISLYAMPITLVSWVLPYWPCRLLVLGCNALVGTGIWYIALVWICWRLPFPTLLIPKIMPRTGH